MSILDAQLILCDEQDINSAAAIDASKIGGGNVSTTEFNYLATITSNVQDQIDNIIAGTITALLDGESFTFGTGLDLDIQHDGSNAIIANSTGDLQIRRHRQVN